MYIRIPLLLIAGDQFCFLEQRHFAFRWRDISILAMFGSLLRRNREKNALLARLCPSLSQHYFHTLTTTLWIPNQIKIHYHSVSSLETQYGDLLEASSKKSLLPLTNSLLLINHLPALSNNDAYPRHKLTFIILPPNFNLRECSVCLFVCSHDRSICH
jgi:hypothetical protein